MAKLKSKLTVADEFFARHHLTEKTMSVSEIAVALGVKESLIQNVVKADAEARMADLRKDRFDVNDGTVSMSEAQSHADDEMRKSGELRQKKFLDKHKRNFIVLDPNKPIR